MNAFIKPWEPNDNPLDIAGNISKGQNVAMNAMQIGETRRTIDRRNAMEDAARQYGDNPVDYQNAIRQIDPQAAMQYSAQKQKDQIEKIKQIHTKWSTPVTSLVIETDKRMSEAQKTGEDPKDIQFDADKKWNALQDQINADMKTMGLPTQPNTPYDKTQITGELHDLKTSLSAYDDSLKRDKLRGEITNQNSMNEQRTKRTQLYDIQIKRDMQKVNTEGAQGLLPGIKYAVGLMDTDPVAAQKSWDGVVKAGTAMGITGIPSAPDTDWADVYSKSMQNQKTNWHTIPGAVDATTGEPILYDPSTAETKTLKGAKSKGSDKETEGDKKMSRLLESYGRDNPDIPKNVLESIIARAEKNTGGLMSEKSLDSEVAPLIDAYRSSNRDKSSLPSSRALGSEWPPKFGNTEGSQPTTSGRKAKDSTGAVFYEQSNGDWLDKNGKPYGGK